MKRRTPIGSVLLAATELQERVDEFLGAVRSLLRLKEQRTGRTAPHIFGKDLIAFCQAAVETMKEAQEVFQHLPFTPEQFATLVQRRQDLSRARDKTEQLGEEISGELHAVEAKLARMASLVLKAARTTVDNPLLDDTIKKQTSAAAKPLFKIMEARRASQRSAILATLARKAEAARSADGASRLRLENRYLAGEELRPEDVGGRPVPAAARQGRRRTLR